jgi:flagellar biosynthesis protein FlhA
MADATQAAAPTELLARIAGALRQGDILVALGVVAILVVLILPMPGWLLDLSLALSFGFSVLILMVSMFIGRPLEFSAFPTVLLISTMMRLSLNLASTRLILGHGHEGTDAAGHVIAAFGSFVMQGNFVIGIIVFAILVTVNFVVITKGSGRIAEVAARFSLDAMPGKQMAIDADLSTGLIDEKEARKRRKALEDESTFYGSMDGAAKFVRGDAVAGLVILFVNVIGGMIIGVGQMGMPFGEAAKVYTLLTIGDGLVSQIPALIVSTAAGLMVSKAGSEGSVDKALLAQLGGYPKALALSSALMVSLALLPGIPMLPFLALAGLTGGAAYTMMRRKDHEAAVALAEEEAAKTAVPAEEPISTALAIDDLRLEIGYGLLALINDGRGVKLTDQIKALRRQLASEMGFVMPSVRILDNMQLPANGYVIRVKEMEAGRGEVRPGQFLVIDPRGERMMLPGEETTEPTFGLPALWIDPQYREEATFRGYTVVDPATVVTTHLTEVLKDNMAEMLSYAETQKLLNEVPKDHQKLIADLIPQHISTGGVQRVLQNLLAERVSIRDLPTILEGIAEATSYTRNVGTITEHVRARLARQISYANTAPEGYIPLVALSPVWEQAFAESIMGQGDERHLSMAPSKLQEFIAAIRTTFDRLAQEGQMPVLLTSPAVRPFVRSIIERFRPQTVVISQSEVHPKAKLRTLAQI